MNLKRLIKNCFNAVRNIFRARPIEGEVREVAPKPVETFNVVDKPWRPTPVRLPRSSFTKKGPGVRARLWDALHRMTKAQRLLCREKTWDRGMVDADGRLIEREAV